MSLDPHDVLLMKGESHINFQKQILNHIFTITITLTSTDRKHYIDYLRKKEKKLQGKWRIGYIISNVH